MNIFYKKNILNNKLILLMFIIPIFIPQSFTLLYGGMLETIFLMWNVVNTVILLCVFIIKKGMVRIYPILFILFWILFLIVSLISTDDLLRSFNTWLGMVSPIINFVLLGVILLKNNIYKINYSKLINVLYKYLVLLLTLNLISIILFPTGLVNMEHVFTTGKIAENTKRVSFMASDNTTIQFLITTLLLTELRYHFYKSGNLLRWIVWVMSILTSLILWSATGVVGILIFLLCAIIFLFPKNKFQISIDIAYLWAGISFFSIVIFRLISYFSFIIVYLLGKDVSLTDRVFIWDIAYSKILEKPWIGWGNISKGWILEHNWYNYYSHNLILDVLLQGGIITLIGVLLIINISRVSLKKQRDRRLESIFSCALLALFTMNITESHFTSVYFYIPFILGSLLPININQNVIKNENI